MTKSVFRSLFTSVAITLTILLLFQNCAEPIPEAKTNTQGNQSSTSGTTGGNTAATSGGAVRCSVSQTLFQGRCFENQKACSVANGQGTQLFRNGAYGPCTLQTCDQGFHEENSVCASNVRACSLVDGSGRVIGNGSQTFASGAWGACAANSCAQGYSPSGSSCVPSVVACDVGNGAGQKTWNGSTYGNCQVTSCNSAFHNENNACVLDVQSCPIANGTGQWTWNPSINNYGACNVVSCNANAFNNNNQCEVVVEGFSALAQQYPYAGCAGAGYQVTVQRTFNRTSNVYEYTLHMNYGADYAYWFEAGTTSTNMAEIGGGYRRDAVTARLNINLSSPQRRLAKVEVSNCKTNPNTGAFWAYTSIDLNDSSFTLAERPANFYHYQDPCDPASPNYDYYSCNGYNDWR